MDQAASEKTGGFVVLKTENGELYLFHREILKCSKKLWTLMGGTMTEDIDPPNVQIEIRPKLEKKIVGKVLDWAIHHKDDPPCSIDLTEEANSLAILEALENRSKDFKATSWDEEYMNSMDFVTKIRLFYAATVMGITDLMTLCCVFIQETKQEEIPKYLQNLLHYTRMEREKLQKNQETADKKSPA